MIPGYLLDTNALSILAPQAAQRTSADSEGSAFRAWVREHDEQLFLSVITLAEIRAGVSRLERKGAAKRAADLAHWLSAVIELYQSKILPLAANIALETGRMIDRAKGMGTNADFEDAAIAATAAVHGLTVVTANARHFKNFGVAFISPSVR